MTRTCNGTRRRCASITRQGIACMVKNAETPTAKVTCDEIASFILSSNMVASGEALAHSLTRRRTASNTTLLLGEVIVVMAKCSCRSSVTLCTDCKNRERPETRSHEVAFKPVPRASAHAYVRTAFVFQHVPLIGLHCICVKRRTMPPVQTRHPRACATHSLCQRRSSALIQVCTVITNSPAAI